MATLYDTAKPSPSRPRGHPVSTARNRPQSSLKYRHQALQPFPPLKEGGLIEALSRLLDRITIAPFPPLKEGGLIEAIGGPTVSMANRTFPPLKEGGLIEAVVVGADRDTESAFRL